MRLIDVPLPQQVAAQRIAYEPFAAAPAASKISPITTLDHLDASAGFGFTGPWTVNGPARINRLETRPTPIGMVSSVGDQLEIQPGGMGRAARRLAQPLSLATDQRYYVSCIVRKFAAKDYGALTLGSADGKGEITIGYDGRYPHAGHTLLFISGSGGITYTAPPLRPDLQLDDRVDYLVVARIDAAATGPDRIAVKLYRCDQPIPFDDTLDGQGGAAGQWSLIGGGDASFAIDHIALSGSGDYNQFDELRIGRTWRSVLPRQSAAAERPAAQH